MSNHKGIVAAGHPATAEAGAAALRMGGNAVDAAIAAVTTSFIAEPVLTSAGGGGFLLLADPQKGNLLYDGFARMPSGRMPAGIEAELNAIPIDFGDSRQLFHIGQGSVATPSLLAMLFSAHQKHGRLPINEAMSPGLEAARSGVRLNALQASFIELLRPILTTTDGCAGLHSIGDNLAAESDLFRNKELANTLEMLCIDGIAEMYHGDLARAIVRSCTPYGLLSMQDMQAEQVHIRKPLTLPLFGGTLLTNPPPSSGGLLIAYAAALLQQLSGKADNAVLAAECLRAASLLRCDQLDARIYDADISGTTLAPQQLDSACQAIQQRLSGLTKPDGGSNEPGNRHGSTTHISIIDSHGMAVSITTSNGEGSGIVVPDSGIHLNNMLGEEDINPLGLHALPAAASLSSMMAPTIFLQHGRPSMIMGSGGSNRLRGAILQVLHHHMVDGMDIEAAVQAPRLHNEGMQLEVEPGRLNESERAQLQQLGWSIRDWQKSSVYFGGVHAISSNRKGQFQAAGDPRRGGAVAYA